MKDKIIMILNYFRLKKYLMYQLDYREHEAIQTIRDIRKMRPELRRAFLDWFLYSNEPQGVLFGIDFQNLMKYRHMNPVAAFLAVDWYSKEPDAAFSVLGMLKKDKDSQLVDGCEEKLKQIGERLNMKPAKLQEDTSDIVSE